MALKLKPTEEETAPPVPPQLKPLDGKSYRCNRGEGQGQHFVDVPSKEYLDALLGADCDRLLHNFRSGIFEFDRGELRLAGDRIVDVIFFKVGGGISIRVIAEHDISFQKIEPRTGTGSWRAWWSGSGVDRWCLLSPAGEIAQTGYTHRQNAEHAASVHNSGSPVPRTAGR